MLDLAALARHEMVLWDNWGLGELGAEPDPGQLAELDEVAAAISSSDVPPAVVRTLFRRDGLRLPPVVSSRSPASEVPLQVSWPFGHPGRAVPAAMPWSPRASSAVRADRDC